MVNDKGDKRGRRKVKDRDGACKGKVGEGFGKDKKRSGGEKRGK